MPGRVISRAAVPQLCALPPYAGPFRIPRSRVCEPGQGKPGLLLHGCMTAWLRGCCLQGTFATRHGTLRPLRPILKRCNGDVRRSEAGFPCSFSGPQTPSKQSTGQASSEQTCKMRALCSAIRLAGWTVVDIDMRDHGRREAAIVTVKSKQRGTSDASGFRCKKSHKSHGRHMMHSPSHACNEVRPMLLNAVALVCHALLPCLASWSDLSLSPSRLQWQSPVPARHLRYPSRRGRHP